MYKNKLSSVIKKIIKEELDEFGQTTDDGGTYTGRYKAHVKKQVEKLKAIERVLDLETFIKNENFESGLIHLEMAIGDFEEFLFSSKNKSDLDESESSLAKMTQDNIDKMSDMLYTAGYEDADKWAKKFSDEGMGPLELEHRLKTGGKDDGSGKFGTLSYNYGIKKRSSLKTEAVDSKLDKAVINAFTDKKPMTGKLLSTDGTTLKVDGFLGGKCAEWVDGKIQFVAPSGKLSQSVNKAIVKLVPSNWLINGTGYKGSL